VLTVRSIDDPFIKAATLTYYTLDFGKPAVSGSSSGILFLIAGLCWTTATWGLTCHQHYKKTNAEGCLHVFMTQQQQLQHHHHQQQAQQQQVQDVSTAANPLAGGGAIPVAMPMAMTIPADDGGIYSQQPAPHMRPAQPSPLVAGLRPQPQPQRVSSDTGGGGGSGPQLSAKDAWEQRRAARMAASAHSGGGAR
jgi:hypothetical protein